jgi:hypothetical protein
MTGAATLPFYAQLGVDDFRVEARTIAIRKTKYQMEDRVSE